MNGDGVTKFESLNVDNVDKSDKSDKSDKAASQIDTSQAPLWCTLTDLLSADRSEFDEIPENRLIACSWRGRVYVGEFRSAQPRGCMACLAISVVQREVPGLVAPSIRTRRLEEQQRNPSNPLIDEVIREGTASLRSGNNSTNNVLVIDTRTLEYSSLAIVPRDDCNACDLTDSSTMPKYGSNEQQMRKSGSALRGGPQRPYSDLSDYVRAGGIFDQTFFDLDSPLGAVETRVPLGNGRSEPGLGRATSFDESRQIAIYEALERHAGINCGGTRKGFRASLESLGDEALDPRVFGVHSSDDYDRDGFEYSPFDPTSTVTWVRALNLLRPDRDVVVPERAAYWGRLHSQDARSYYDSSNGTALGSTPEEATLHALLELVERDSFMLTWYLKLALPEISFDSRDTTLWPLVQRCELFSGFRIRLFYAAMESGIPVVIAYAENRSSSGPRRFVSAGSSLDTAAAATSAVKEVIGILLATQATWPAQQERGLKLIQNPEHVTDMMDHSLIGSMPAAKEWFDFLVSRSEGSLELRSLPSYAPRRTSIRQDFEQIVNQLGEVGLTSYVVDMTTAELRWKALHCVRALVPGLLPMTFGHRYRRTTGLERLSSQELPYRSQLGGDSPLATPPHPFP